MIYGKLREMQGNIPCRHGSVMKFWNKTAPSKLRNQELSLKVHNKKCLETYKGIYKDITCLKSTNHNNMKTSEIMILYAIWNPKGLLNPKRSLTISILIQSFYFSKKTIIKYHIQAIYTISRWKKNRTNKNSPNVSFFGSVCQIRIDFF